MQRRFLLLLIFWLAVVMGFAQSLQQYEYWVDNGYEERVTRQGSSTDISLMIEGSNLRPGLHYFNVRAQNDRGLWGPMKREFFYIPSQSDAPHSNARFYEYWVDQAYDKKTTMKSSDDAVVLNFEGSNLRPGLHYFNVRAQNDRGLWGPMKREFFYIPGQSDAPHSNARFYEYWIDQAYDKKTTMKSSDDAVVLNFEGSNLRPGLHYFNVRAQNDRGLWGPMKREFFYIPDKKIATGNSPIIGYEYFFGSGTFYVPITPTETYELSNYVIDLPNLSGFSSLEQGCVWTFAGENVKLNRANVLPFGIRFLNQRGDWSVSVTDDLQVSDSISKTTKPLYPEQQIKLTKPAKGDFEPIEITVDQTRDYYVRSTQACKMHLFNASGKLIKTITSEQMLLCERLDLEAGTYYGIIYDTQIDESNPGTTVSVLLTLEANRLLPPTIAYENEMVTISTELTDVELHYTIDGTLPTAQSTLYTKPFALRHNATIQAVATQEGKTPSTIASYVVDSYKVADVTFATDGYMLTMTTTTDSATIHYTLDGAMPTVESPAYTGPIALSGGCTVKAFAIRSHYNDSEVSDFLFDAGPVTATVPQLVHDGNVVSITTTTSETVIYYTTDGSEPTKESTRYTQPFHVVQNGVIKAIATRSKYFDSQIGTLTVDWFKVADVVFTSDGYVLTMKSDTARAAIHYTLDGSVPTQESTLYNEPVTLTSACTVKAIATRDNFYDSEVTEYAFVPSVVTVATPKFSHEGNIVSIMTGTEKASIYYTFNGDTPTNADSLLYRSPFEVVRNGVIKAIAMRKNYFDSQVAELTVDWFKVADVGFETDGYMLTLSTPTPNTTIYYTLDGTVPTTASLKYTSPVALTTACTVSAIAVREGYNNSDVTTMNFLPDVVTAATPQIIHDGNIISITSSTSGATIYYTTDGSEPTTSSQVYSNAFTVAQNCTIKAIATKDSYFNSTIATLVVDWFTSSPVVFTLDGYMLKMTTDMAESSIYYTLDGSVPTAQSNLYAEPIRLTTTCSVKALSMRKNYNSSSVTEYAFNADSVTVAVPRIVHDGNMVSITTQTEGASVYYTVNGEMPKAESSLLYRGPFEVLRNGVVKAIAMRENYFDSQVAELTVDWFKVADVSFETDGYMLTLSTLTPDATIYYTLDGTVPTTASLKYNNSISLTIDCTVSAVAVRDGYNNSDVTSIHFQPGVVTVSTPQIIHDGNIISITTSTSGATIYYTTDGSEPTTSSQVYSNAFTVAQNCTVRAIAMKDNYFNSSIATLVVDWFKVADVTFTADGYRLSMATTTPSAVIYYTLDGTIPSVQSDKYSSPISLSEACTVRAIAMLDGYKNSDVTSFEFMPGVVTTATPQIVHDGNFISISTTTVDAEIYYTIDGTEPTTASSRYANSFVVSQNCVIKAIAVKEGFFNSAVATLQVDWFKVEDVTFLAKGYQVTMSTATEDATIYYTLDGSTPTIESIKYNAPITLQNDCQIKAFAVRAGYANSDVTAFDFSPNTVTVATPKITHVGNSVSMSTTTDGATIYYTLNGEEPTAATGIRYVGKFDVTHNCTVKAIGVRESYFNSQVATMVVDWFQVDKVRISTEGFVLTMTTDTLGTTIYYTLDGSTPTTMSTRYLTPVSLAKEKCDVKAIGVKSEYKDSEVASLSFNPADATVAAPQMAHTNNLVSLTTAMSDATIYFTLDGTNPTAASTRYEKAFEVTRNLTLKAMAMRSNYFDSEVMEWAVDWFKVADVKFSHNQTDEGVWLTMATETPDADIYYGIGDGVEPTIRYTEPILLKDNRPVNAVARKDGYNDSETSVFSQGELTCPDVAISFDGHYVTMTSGDDVDIYYTTDGSNPSTASAIYEGPVAMNCLGVVKAFAHKEYVKDSPVSSLELNYVYDGTHAEVKAEGQLAKAFEWCGNQNVQTLEVEGPLGMVDFELLRKLPNLRILNMEQVALPDGVMTDSLLAGARMKWFVSPVDIKRVGTGVMAKCERLAAVTWNSTTTRLDASAFDDNRNPNMLFYVKSVSMMAIDGVNVVSGGLSSGITLCDGEGYSDFYCPESFLTDTVSYSHTYGMQTMEGVCRGWESLSLPFDVQTVRHENKGELVPFVLWQQKRDNRKPFWLGSLSERGFAKDSVIKAYVPYIISMPNSDAYADRFVLKGKVTFAARNVTIAATEDASVPSVMGDVSFIPNFERLSPSPDVYGLNLYEPYDAHPEGSIFLPNYRTVLPFEAYTTSVNAARAMINIGKLIGDDAETDIQGVRFFSGDSDGHYYNLQGQRIDEPKRKGVYLRKGKKVIMK